MKNKKRIWLLFGVSALMIAILLFGYINRNYIGKGEVTAEKGVYYQELKVDDFSWNQGDVASGSYAYGVMYYNGRIYTGYDVIYDLDSDDISEAELNRISEVYTNNYVSWTDDRRMLSAVDNEGQIYQYENIDPAKVVVLRYKTYEDFLDESTAVWCTGVYEATNGMYLMKGKDLYDDYFHILDAAKITVDQGDTQVSLNREDDAVSALLDAIYQTEFQEKCDDKGEKICTLIFEDAIGMKRELELYSAGGVIYKNPEGTKFYLQIDPSVIQRVQEIK